MAFIYNAIMVQREEFPREAYQRWLARCDADWRRRQGRWMPVLFAAALVCAYLGSDLFSPYYYMSLLSHITQGAAFTRTGTIVWLFVLPALSFAALPLGLWLGVQRARAAQLADELAWPFSTDQRYSMSLHTARRALCRTAVPLALPALLLQSMERGLLMPGPVSFLLPPAGGNPAQLPQFATAVWQLVCCLGFLACVIEWQALLVSRFPPRRVLVWLQLLPCALPVAGHWLAQAIFAAAPQLAMVDEQGSAPWHGLSSHDLVQLALLTGLLAAPLLWRWAAAAEHAWRWGILAAGLLAGLAVPQVYFLAYYPLHPALLPTALSICRGAYLGAPSPALMGLGMLEQNPCQSDVIAVALARGSLYTAKPGAERFYSPIELEGCRLPGPGVALAARLFLPWYIALPLLVLYYLYCIAVLRRCAARAPVAAES